MNKKFVSTAVAYLLSAGVVVIACGGDSSSGDDLPPPGSGEDASVGSDGSPSGDGDGSSNPGDGGPGGRDVCASASPPNVPGPLNVVVMLDHSGSMGNDSGEPNLANRWAPVTAALNMLFADPQAGGMKASLRDYPTPAASNECDPVYDKPQVPLTLLPNPTAFKNSITSDGAPVGNSTLMPALEGAVAYAKAQGSKTVILFVTDGLPDEPAPPKGPCRETYAQVQSIAKSAATVSGIKTYVLGAGTSAYHAEIDKLAADGGTGKALWINIKDPHGTEQELLGKLAQERSPVVTCSITVPNAPSGKTFDYNAVDVTITPDQGQPTKVPYSPSCEGGLGWQYDNAQAPKKILLCATTCSTIKSASTKTTASFACVD